jgi:site-specific DNA-methyltransferase (adenine-specific)
MEIKLDNIYNVDCLEGMKAMPDGFVDLTVTSPPYNAGIDYGECYNDNKPLEEYLAFIKAVFTETFRITKDGGRVVINVANTGRQPYIPLSSYINLMMIEIGYHCRGEIIWDKGASVGTSCAWGSWRSPSNPSLRDVHEYIMVYSKGDYKHDGNGDATIEADEFTESTKSIWKMQTANATAVGHPAPYPEIFPRKIMRLYSYTNDVTFDPFMGSGTTAIAAIKEKRHFIGFELNKKFFEKAQREIKSEQAQLTLF